MDALEREEFFFGGNPFTTAVAGDGVAGAEHSVTGDDDGHRVFPYCAADRSSGLFTPHSAAKFLVTNARAIRNRGKLSPNGLLKVGTKACHRKVKIFSDSREVFLQLERSALKEFRVLAAVRPWRGVWPNSHTGDGLVAGRNGE